MVVEEDLFTNRLMDRGLSAAEIFMMMISVNFSLELFSPVRGGSQPHCCIEGMVVERLILEPFETVPRYVQPPSIAILGGISVESPCENVN